jgi:hypothetical protein
MKKVDEESDGSDECYLCGGAAEKFAHPLSAEGRPHYGWGMGSRFQSSLLYDNLGGFPRTIGADRRIQRQNHPDSAF